MDITIKAWTGIERTNHSRRNYAILLYLSSVVIPELASPICNEFVELLSRRLQNW